MKRNGTANRPLTEDEAWIVSHNMRLVGRCMRPYQRHDDATQADLKQAGYVGLCRAIKLYDPRLACWSTYATFWIRNFMQRELVHMAMIAVPAYQRYNTTKSAPKGKERYGHLAQRAMSGQRVRWQDEEAETVLAVSQPEAIPDERPEITAVLAKVSPRAREIVRRSVMAGERIEDIATDMDITVRKASSLRRFAIRQLHVLLKDKNL